MTRVTEKTPVVWITRTQPAARESAKSWEALGAQVIVSPLLRVRPTPSRDTPAPESLIIFTSKNGVDHFASRNHPVLCVGDATAAHARAAGFTTVTSVDGTSADITAWVIANVPLGQPVTHISGRHVRGSIVEDLRMAGYAAQRIIVYHSAPVPHLPDVAFTHVALYSPLAAQTFAQLSELPVCTTLSISPATDAVLASLEDVDRRVAARPTEPAMLALLHMSGEG